MKKALLSLAAVALAMTASAQNSNIGGITAVGANITIVPSVEYSQEAWTGWSYVINSGENYGDWSSENPNYGVLCGDEPAEDSAGNMWYEVNYDPTDDATIGDNMYTGEEIVWEEHTAPFSSDETYKGLPSYQWTTSSIMADVYIRRSFTTTNLLSGTVYLSCGHDDAPCEFYLNGELVYENLGGSPGTGGDWDTGAFVKLTDEQKALIKNDGSENVIAIHVHQNWGGAYADCGIYTLIEGGVDMGYVTPWTGKTIFNSCGGYDWSGVKGNVSAIHGWEKLYEAQPGDAYTIQIPYETMDEWQAQLHFKTPINIDPTHEYTFKAKFNATADVDEFTIKLCEMNDDEVVLNEDMESLAEGEDLDYEATFSGTEVKDFKVVLNFNWTYDNSECTISDISLYDETEGKELWVGTHYFNYMYFTNNGTHVKDPALTGRTETLAWTQLDFDDSDWNDTEMPIGNSGYMPELQSIWPEGINNNAEQNGNTSDNTGYWIRRTFTMGDINPKLTYFLLVCHDDDYKTYVNGNLLQENVGWSDGKNPFSVRIPSSMLNANGDNVIATEIHQNWGGRFYDCGIGIEEVDFDAQAAKLQKVIDDINGFTGDLTQAMRSILEGYLTDANNVMASKDAWDIRDKAAELAPKVSTILGYSEAVSNGRILLDYFANLKGTEIANHRPDAADFEACETPAQINAFWNDARKATKRDAQERRTEKFVGSEVADGDFYIYNVGEKLFLGGGESWGAHAALEYASNAMTLVYHDEEEVVDPESGDVTGTNPAGYVIQTHRPNGTEGINDYLGYNGYVDVSGQDRWVFVPVEGKNNVYNIRRPGDNGENGVYLGYRGAKSSAHESGYDNQNGYSWCTIDSDMRTASLESNQWMLISKEELDAFAEKATATAPADMTHLIVNPGFDQRWTMDAWETNGSVWGRNSDHPDFIHENFESDCMIGQEIVDDALLEGWYTLEVQGYYRDGSKENHTAILEAGQEPQQYAILYAGDQEIPLRRIDDNDVNIPYTLNSTHVYNGINCPDFPTDAAEFFEHGAYWNTLTFYCDGGELYFGVEGNDPDMAQGRWTVIDNFRLKYYGQDEPSTGGLRGDANNDGNVTMADANLVVNAYTTGDDSKLNKKNADVTNDDNITMADANGIVNIYVGGGN